MSETIKPKHAGGRPRTGYLEMRGKCWCAQLTVNIDGESVRKWFNLGTDSKAIARRKLARLLKEHALGVVPSPEAAKAPETVDLFAEAWIASRRARGIASVDYEARYYERVWSPAIGKLALGAVTAGHIRAVLEEVATGAIRPTKRKGQKTEPEPYSRQSICHIRATAFRLFDSAWRDEIISENRVSRVLVPEMAEEHKARAVLTDDEIGTLVAHPDVDAEIKLLVLLSRTIGGLRSGDLNSLDWTAFGPDFATCTFVRRKTRRKNPHPQTLEVAAPVRGFLAAWWRAQGCPVSGPVFPARRGKRAGQAKKKSNMSYADRLRRELLKAGINRHELHNETATTLPVDFHSTRRAYATALARIGVNEQTAMVLTGHSDPKVHQRYVESASIRALPSGALPAISTSALANFTRKKGTKSGANSDLGAGSDSQSGLFSGAGHEARTRDPELGNDARSWNHADSGLPW